MFDINNPILNTDSYKASHFLQYPPGTERVSSYIEARGVDRDGPLPESAEVCFFGLQAFLIDYMQRRIAAYDIEEAEEFFAAHGEPFNREGWEIIHREHDGFLPVEISAIPEGLCLPPSNVLVQVINTDTRLPWVTSYIETALLRAVWYPTTVATISREAKKVIKRYLDLTCDDPDGQLPFKLHDFGARGVSSFESAALGGCAHLVNFMGSDTVAGVVGANNWYTEHMAGFSIPAAEHSTITAWGRAHETNAYANMLKKFAGPGKIVAVVSDSYDIMNAVENIWGGELRDAVKTNGGTIVIRPDSGDPAKTVLEVVGRLSAAFSDFTLINKKGFQLLPPYLRVIQGDGVNIESIDKILDALCRCGYSAENVAFGMGGALLQKLDRDTLKFAMKASAAQVNGIWRDVYKQPVGDASKKSKPGRLALRRIDGSHGVSFETVDINACPDSENMLQPVYRNGQILKNQTLAEIRARAKI
jgi:nicotinamide phosphoribosyltransferase